MVHSLAIKRIDPELWLKADHITRRARHSLFATSLHPILHLDHGLSTTSLHTRLSASILCGDIYSHVLDANVPHTMHQNPGSTVSVTTRMVILTTKQHLLGVVDLSGLIVDGVKSAQYTPLGCRQGGGSIVAIGANVQVLGW